MKKKLTLLDAVRAIEAAGFRSGGDLVSLDYRLSSSGGLFVTRFPGDKSHGDHQDLSFTVDENGRVHKPDEFAASLAAAVDRRKAMTAAGAIAA